MDVYLSGKRIRLDPAASVGKGGEADVFDLGDGSVIKLWKTPEHPDYAGQDEEQAAARDRIEQQQTKIRAFPRGLPDRVVSPIDIVTADKRGARVAGYRMTFIRGAEVLLRYGQPSFRGAGVTAAELVAVLLDLHRTVEAIHASGVVIGDFNDLNVLVRGHEAFLIDADSFQFGPFLCRVFTERFVDPLLSAGAARPSLARPYGTHSDWYAFAVMVMQSLLSVGPYGGVFRPRSASHRVPESARPLRRITVFHPEVMYPKPAIPLRVLPDELLGELHRIFVEDRRGAFPRQLLSALSFQRCPSCGVEHARAVCPLCNVVVSAAAQAVTIIRGKVTCARIAMTSGVILAAAVAGGEIRYLVHEDGALLREDGSVVLTGRPDPRMVFAIQGRTTLIGRGAEIIAFGPDAPSERIFVDCLGSRPLFAANARFRYWVRGGRLYREGELVGDVLAGQTLFWVGSRFGFGFYRAGSLTVAFVFDAARPGLKDTVKLPPLRGQLVGADCAVGDERAFVFFAVSEGGRTAHRCVAVSADGVVEASAEAEAGDGSWLGAIHGRAAVGGALLAATDDGIVRVEVKQGALVETRAYPDTEPFVSQGARLIAGGGGLFVIEPRSISHLKIA